MCEESSAEREREKWGTENGEETIGVDLELDEKSAARKTKNSSKFSIRVARELSLLIKQAKISSEFH